MVLLLYNFYSLHCPLSGPDLIYISLLIIPCIIYYVTNKETLNTETALVKITNDLQVLLDLSTAFDTVDHDILIDRFQNYTGIQGHALR